MENKVSRPCVDPELLDQLGALSTPELCDGMMPFRAMDYHVKLWAGEKLIGTAFTVYVPMGSSDLVAQAIEEAQPGDVLVLAGQGNCYGSLWGDFKSQCAKRRGLAGVVIDGAFRDLTGCKKADLPLFARAVVCGSVQKSSYGAINTPVSCAGVVVCPGDIIVGDENGVCVITQEEAKEVLIRARKKAEIQREKERMMGSDVL